MKKFLYIKKGFKGFYSVLVKELYINKLEQYIMPSLKKRIVKGNNKNLAALNFEIAVMINTFIYC